MDGNTHDIVYSGNVIWSLAAHQVCNLQAKGMLSEKGLHWESK